MTQVNTTSSASSDIRTDFMKLMVTQLQNQNPLDPMSNTDMTAQLAQLSQLEQMENMSSTFRQVLAASQKSQAAGMIGKFVRFIPDGSDKPIESRVRGIEMLGDDIYVDVFNNVKYIKGGITAQGTDRLNELEQASGLTPLDTFSVYGYKPDGSEVNGGHGAQVSLHDGTEFITIDELLTTITNIYRVDGKETYKAELNDGEIQLVDSTGRSMSDKLFIAYDSAGDGSFDTPHYMRRLPMLSEITSIRD